MDHFHGNSQNRPCIFVCESRQIQSKQVWSKCHTINYLQTKGGAILGNIGSQSFILYMLPQLWARIPQYGLRTWLIRSY